MKTVRKKQRHSKRRFSKGKKTKRRINKKTNKKYQKRIKRKTSRQTKRKIKRSVKRYDIQKGGGATGNIKEMLTICSKIEFSKWFKKMIQQNLENLLNILFVRHGISESNELPSKLEPINGRRHPFLTMLGRQQAYAFGYDTLYEKWLREGSIKKVEFSCSCLPRACETAKLISQGFMDRLSLPQGGGGRQTGGSNSTFIEKLQKQTIKLINGISEIPEKMFYLKGPLLRGTQRSITGDLLKNVVQILNQMDKGLPLDDTVKNTERNALVGFAGVDAGDIEYITTEESFNSFANRIPEIFKGCEDSINVCVVHGKFIQQKMVSGSTLSAFPVENGIPLHGPEPDTADKPENDSNYSDGMLFMGGGMKGGGDDRLTVLNPDIRKCNIVLNELHLYVKGPDKSSLQLGITTPNTTGGFVELKPNVTWDRHKKLISQLVGLNLMEVYEINDRGERIPDEQPGPAEQEPELAEQGPSYVSTRPGPVEPEQVESRGGGANTGDEKKLFRFVFSLDGKSVEELNTLYASCWLTNIYIQLNRNLILLSLLIDSSANNPFRESSNQNPDGTGHISGDGVKIQGEEIPYQSLSKSAPLTQLGWEEHQTNKRNTLRKIKELVESFSENDMIRIKNLFLLIQFLGSKAVELSAIISGKKAGKYFDIIQKMHMYAYLKHVPDSTDDETVKSIMGGESNSAFRLYPPNLCACDFTLNLTSMYYSEAFDTELQTAFRTGLDYPDAFRNGWEILKMFALKKATYYTPSLMALKSPVETTYGYITDPGILLLRESIKKNKAKGIDPYRNQMISRIGEIASMGEERRQASNLVKAIDILNYIAPKPYFGSGYTDFEVEKTRVRNIVRAA
tara:strand:+ start:1938 stop:4493 length:2556 start_codon:yes stop_codon:yes gene_type:complete